MSLFIGFITKDSAYIGTDARTWIDIPSVGIRTYDIIRKLGSFASKGRIWVADAGLANAAARVYDALDCYSVLSTDDILNIDEGLFKVSHKEALNKFGIDVNKSNDLRYCMMLLFIGLDQYNSPKMCLVDSANNYQKQWFDKPGDFVFNRLNYAPAESYLKTHLGSLVSETIMKEDVSCEYVIKRMKKIFSYISDCNFGIGPLAYFAKISDKEAIYKKFHFLSKLFSKIRYNIDYMLYLRDLQKNI